MAPAGTLVVAAMCLAAGCGFSAWRACEAWRRARRHKASIVDGSEEGRAAGGRSVADVTIGCMERLSVPVPSGTRRRAVPEFLAGGKGLHEAIRIAGLEGRVTPQGYAEAKVRLAAFAGIAGLACGLVFSPQLAVVLALAGAGAGLWLPRHALATRAKERAHEAERHLPEMLDVVALGMRSGLPFDSSLRIYASHFDTLLSRELESARVQWSCGLARRDEALRKLASTYDSPVLGRVVDTVVKSVRYGSSMVSSLESDAAEARSAYQARREERIAKAPVKMMVPTGVLILPAMLIMVLGPVLLELVQGGI